MAEGAETQGARFYVLVGCSGAARGECSSAPAGAQSRGFCPVEGGEYTLGAAPTALGIRCASATQPLRTGLACGAPTALEVGREGGVSAAEGAQRASGQSRFAGRELSYRRALAGCPSRDGGSRLNAGGMTPMGVEQMGKEGMEGGQEDGPPLRGED